MTCIGEVLKAVRFLVDSSADGTFRPIDVVNRMQRMGTSFSESTIRTHIVSRMCQNVPINHAVKYDDIERVGRGRYRLRE